VGDEDVVDGVPKLSVGCSRTRIDIVGELYAYFSVRGRSHQNGRLWRGDSGLEREEAEGVRSSRGMMRTLESKDGGGEVSALISRQQ
jgi:hypothetical protein